MGNEFEIDAYRKGRELLVALRGHLVMPYCSETKTRLASLFTPQVDQAYLYLAELSFLDSAGLGVLVGTKVAATQNRIRLVFLAPPSRVQDIFSISKLDSIFEIRGGAEADVIHAALAREEFCLWRDGRESAQARFLMETNPASFTPSTTSGSGSITTRPTGRGSRSEDPNANRVRELCDNAVEFIRQGDHERAIQAYREAIELNPDNLSALNNLGVVYEKRAEWYKLAVDVWRRVLEISQAQNDEKHAGRARRHLDSLSKLIRSN